MVRLPKHVFGTIVIPAGACHLELNAEGSIISPGLSNSQICLQVGISLPEILPSNPSNWAVENGRPASLGTADTRKLLRGVREIAYRTTPTNAAEFKPGRCLWLQVNYQENQPGGTTAEQRRTIYGHLLRIADMTDRVVTLEDPLGRDYDQIVTSAEDGQYFVEPLWSSTQDRYCVDIAIRGGTWVCNPGANAVGGVIGTTGFSIEGVYGLQIEAVRISEFGNAGIYARGCSKVSIRDCFLESNRRKETPNRYGINLRECAGTVIEDDHIENARYGAVVVGGCQHAVRRITANSKVSFKDATNTEPDVKAIDEYLFETHGGDVDGLLIEDIGSFGMPGFAEDGAILDVRIGNGTWPRGARNVTMRNCRIAELKLTGSVRSFLAQECDFSVVTSTCTTDSLGKSIPTTSGGGVSDVTPTLMNRMGAGTGITGGATFSGCTTEVPASFGSTDVPAACFQVFTGGGKRGVNGLTFQDCTFRKKKAANKNFGVFLVSPSDATSSGSPNFTPVTRTDMKPRGALSFTRCTFDFAGQNEVIGNMLVQVFAYNDSSNRLSAVATFLDCTILRDVNSDSNKVIKIAGTSTRTDVMGCIISLGNNVGTSLSSVAAVGVGEFQIADPKSEFIRTTGSSPNQNNILIIGNQ